MIPWSLSPRRGHSRNCRIHNFQYRSRTAVETLALLISRDRAALRESTHRWIVALGKGAFVACLFAGICSFCSGEKSHHVAILILDAKSGKPIGRASLGLSVSNERGQLVGLSNTVTNDQGVADIDLAPPIPERIQIDFSPIELHRCSDLAFPTNQILQKGLVARYTCQHHKLKSPVTAKPGELIIFSERVTLWERLLSEIP